MADTRVKTEPVVPAFECSYCLNEYIDLDAHTPDCMRRAEHMVAEHRKQQEVQCLAEIQAVLDSYGMQLTTAPAQIVLGPRSS